MFAASASTEKLQQQRVQSETEDCGKPYSWRSRAEILKKKLDQVDAERDSLATSYRRVGDELAQMSEQRKMDRETIIFLSKKLTASSSFCQEMTSLYEEQLCQLNKTIQEQKQLILSLHIQAQQLKLEKKPQEVQSASKETMELASWQKRFSELKDSESQTKAELASLRELLYETIEWTSHLSVGQKRTKCLDDRQEIGAVNTGSTTEKNEQTLVKRQKNETLKHESE